MATTINTVDTYAHRLNVAFTHYVSRVEAGTGQRVTGDLLEAHATNYAFEAAKDVTGAIMDNSRKLNRKSTRPAEFAISKRRIDAAWTEMNLITGSFPSKTFTEGLIKMLTALSTPTEAELVSSEVIGDQKMIERTTSDYKEILGFLQTCL